MDPPQKDNGQQGQNFLEDRQFMISLFNAAATQSPKDLETIIHQAQKTYNDHKNSINKATDKEKCKVCIERDKTKSSETQYDLLLSIKDGNKRTVAHFAALGERIENLKYCIEACPSLLEAKDVDGDTVLLMCCRAGNFEGVSYLLEKGACIHVINQTQCMTPLHLATQASDHSILNLLVPYFDSQDINAMSALGSCLQIAAMKHDNELIKLLLDLGCNPNRTYPPAGASEELRQIAASLPSALLLCCNMGNTKAVEMLLEKNANPNILDPEGWSALHCAAEAGNVECVQLLLAHGADKDVTKDGITPFDIAVKHGHKDAGKALCDLSIKEIEERIAKQEAHIAEKEKKIEDNSKYDIPKAESLKSEATSDLINKNYDSAIQKCKSALELCPKNANQLRADLWRIKSHANCLLKAYQDAIKDADEAIQCYPDSWESHYQRAEACKGFGDLPEAAQSLWDAYNRNRQNENLLKEFSKVVNEARSEKSW